MKIRAKIDCIAINCGGFFYFCEKYASENIDLFFQHQVIAMAVKNGKPIAYGVNKRRHYKNHSTYKCFCHAEIDLLRQFQKDLKKLKNCKIFVFRFNNSSHPTAREAKNAKPCIFCQHALKEAGASRIYYFNDDGELNCLRNRDLNNTFAQPHNITNWWAIKNGPKHIIQTEYILR